MLSILLAGASALVWGAADYCGGMAVHRANKTMRGRAVAIAVLSHVAAVGLILPLLLMVPGNPTPAALLWGAAAGAASLFGVVCLFEALASGSMATVAPIAAATAALVPIVGGLWIGERPTLGAMIGAGTAVVAIGLISAGSSNGVNALASRPVMLALVSGVLFGLFFLMLAQAGHDSGMWPLLTDKLASVGLGMFVLWRIGGSLQFARKRAHVFRLAVLAGTLDTLATALYLFSTHQGQVSIVAPIASLYPASTVVLALLLNRERLRFAQFAGIGLAGMALVLAAS